MAWFEAHDTLGRHPKTLRLARLLKEHRRYAVGLLHDLFAWGLSAADKNGLLRGITREDLAMALDCPPKQVDTLIGALLEAGFLEEWPEGYAIHDWYDYAGKLNDAREKNRVKNQEYRDRKRRIEEYGKNIHSVI